MDRDETSKNPIAHGTYSDHRPINNKSPHIDFGGSTAI